MKIKTSGAVERAAPLTGAALAKNLRARGNLSPLEIELVAMLSRMTAAAHRQGANSSLAGLADDAAELLARATA